MHLFELLQGERVALINAVALVATALVGRQSAALPRKRARCCRSRSHSHSHHH
jgi:hypothetical protein